MKIKDLPNYARPRERLVSMGVENLKLWELLALIIGSGSKSYDVGSIAQNISKKYSLTELKFVSYTDLLTVSGLSMSKAASLVAAIEIGIRTNQNIADSEIIDSTQDALHQIKELRKFKKEYFICLYLNARNQLVHKELITIGSLNYAIVSPRDIFIPALEHSALYLIMAHNHPSGNPVPSNNDLELTTRIVKAGKLLGIEIIDHIIITAQIHYSFKEEKLI